VFLAIIAKCFYFKVLIVKEILLFTDGSVNVQSNIGFGAALLVQDVNQTIDSFNKLVKVKRFENTSSTKLELETLLWALNDDQLQNNKVVIYTDSQNIIGLPGRRARFERNNYSSRKNERIKNYKLYQEFYRLMDELDCELVKVLGHQQTHRKDSIHKIFTLVDRASRSALRDDSM
jgi:ribonuclease HI